MQYELNLEESNEANGKSKEIPNIMWHIPRFTGRYIEPFFGGAALFFYLEPRQAIINDINEFDALKSITSRRTS